ncbi:MAG: hypothetical protein KAZ88_10285 [Acidimicrobiia bacterium]|nr:hypothetical protein [Acidimicrobiia bacterium]
MPKDINSWTMIWTSQDSMNMVFLFLLGSYYLWDPTEGFSARASMLLADGHHRFG